MRIISIFYQVNRLTSYKSEEKLIKQIERAAKDAIKQYEEGCRFEKDAAGMKYFE